jgi:hypothetical protein
VKLPHVYDEDLQNTIGIGAKVGSGALSSLLKRSEVQLNYAGNQAWERLDTDLVLVTILFLKSSFNGFRAGSVASAGVGHHDQNALLVRLFRDCTSMKPPPELSLRLVMSCSSSEK